MTKDQFKNRQSFAGLTNKELAEGLGVSERQVKRYRSGETPIDKRTAAMLISLTPDYKEE